MKAIYFCGIIAAMSVGCSSSQNVLSTHEIIPEAQNLMPSNRVRYQMKTEGLPTSGRWKSTPKLVDINQDGLLDLASYPRLEHGARVWLANKQGGWTDASQGLEIENSCGGGLELADINKDGKLDIAVADHCNGVFVYLGDKDNTWKNTTKNMISALAQKIETSDSEGRLNSLKGTEDLALDDVNEDGFLDIVTVGSDEGGFSVYLGDGSGKKWHQTKSDGLPSGENPGTDENRGGWANDVQLHDMNNDKHLDIVASYYSGPRIWLGDGKGHWQPKAEGLTVTSLGGVFRRLSVADINNDGLKDLAVANNLNGAEAYLQKPDGTWQGPTDIMTQIKEGASTVALGDLDNDGHMDAVIGGRLSDKVTSPGGLHIVFGDGKGQWQQEKGTGLPTEGMEEIWGIALADLNGDKRLDIVATSGSTSTNTFTVHSQSVNAPVNSLALGNRNRLKKNSPQLPHLQVWLSEPIEKKPH